MIQLPKMKCKVHPNEDISLARISQQSGEQFCCLQCLSGDEQKNSFISLTEVIENKEFSPILNWPLGIEKSALDFLGANSSKNPKGYFEQKIKTFFKELQSEILKSIEESQVKALEELEKCFIGQIDPINLYNQCFKRTELVNLLISDAQNINEKYSQLLSSLEETREKDLSELYKQIETLQRIEQEFNFDQPQQISVISNQLLSKMNFFSPYLNVKQVEYTMSYEQQQITNYLNNNLNNLASLVSHNIAKNQELKMDQIKYQQNTLEKINSSSMNNQLKHSNNTHDKLSLIKSSFKESSQILIGTNEENNIFVTNQGANIFGCVYSNTALNKSKSYTIRFHFNPALTSCNFDLGLINEKQLDDYIYSSLQSFSSNENGQCHNTAIKGFYLHFSKYEKFIDQLEMRVNLDQGIILYSDYPNYDNVFQNRHPIQSDCDYRLCIGLTFEQNRVITITHFSEQDEFIPFQLY